MHKLKPKNWFSRDDYVDNSLSKGERHMAFAYAVVAICGAIIGYAVVLRLSHGAVLGRALTAFEIWMIAASAMGSMIGLYLAGDSFGQPGWAGLWKAARASLWVSFVSSIVGGSLMLPFYGTMFGPFTLVVTLAAAPLLGVLWFLNLLGAHGLISTWQKERDTIFEAFETGRVYRD
jgi:hypothetical protein